MRLVAIAFACLGMASGSMARAGQPIAKNLATLPGALVAIPARAVAGEPRNAVVQPSGSALTRKPALNTTWASWYGGSEKLSRRTASGEIFRPDALTAAHRTLPLGTRLFVSAYGRSVIVRVNDRGPIKSSGRSLDLSRGAARALGMIARGTSRVSWRLASQ